MTDKIISDEANPFVIKFDGKKYRMKRLRGKIVDHKLHGGEIVFVPYDETEWKNDINFIVDEIEKMVDKKELLMEVFNNMEIDRIKKIKKLLQKKAPIKKTHGCYGITIGNDSKGEYIQFA